jgi:hypothetical protein
VLKLAFISPIPHLEDFAACGDFDLALAHLFEKDKKYFEYHKRQADAGKYILLDNGTYELGRPYGIDQLVDIALSVGASEIIAPDMLKKKDETIEMTMKFLNDFGKRYPALLNRKIKVHAVVQGDTIQEWTECLKEFLAEPRIDVIGLADDPDFVVPGAKTAINKVQQRVENRLRMLHIIEEIAYSQIREGFQGVFGPEVDPRVVFRKEFHLLGLEDGREFLELPSWVRSCDSYSAFKNGIDGIRYCETGLPNGIKGPTRVDMHKAYSDKLYPNVYWNIAMLRRFAMKVGLSRTWR